jgi:protein-tyrosine phosphatase
MGFAEPNHRSCALNQTELPFEPWRFVPMQGTINTRDVGGYPTTDGRVVVRGRIYRSANLAQLSDADVERLVDLGITTVVDFRGPKEASDDPDHLPPGADYVNSPIIGSTRGDEIDDAAIARMIAAAGLPPTMLDRARVTPHGPFYRMLYLVDSYGTDQHVLRLRGYRALFEKLLALPVGENLLFHCTGGRDRTGVGAALLLRTLGVSDQLIDADFVATNRYLQVDRDDPDTVAFLKFKSANVFLQPSSNRYFADVARQLGATPDALRGAVELKAVLLHRMYAAIDRLYGDFDAFSHQELGVGREERDRLRALYTQP